MRVEGTDDFRHCYVDKLTTEDQQRAVNDIDPVMRAVFDIRRNADPSDVKKLFAILKPGDPHELECVTIEKAA